MEDQQIQLDALEELEECYYDDIEAMLLEPPPTNLAKETIEVNLLQQFTKAYPCSICSHTVGTSKHRQCGACGETVHVSCLPSKPGIGYWFCQDCSPSLTHGHADPALNIPLHNLIRGGTSYPGGSKEEIEEMKAMYAFVRGCLVFKSEDGEKIIPPPCLRADIIHKAHEDLVHMGWERTYQTLKLTYTWPGMRGEVKQLCQACLSCQLSSGVFRRKHTISSHLRANSPREAWSIDLAPGLKMPGGERSNIVVCVDDFSKFVILDILPGRQANDLKIWTLKNILGPYGRPLQIRTDRGNEFAGIFSHFLKEHNIKHVQCRPHSPWTNGRAERMVKTTKDCIRRVLHEYQGQDWSLLIPYLQNSINSCAARATGLCPSEVFLGEAGRPLLDKFAVVLGGKLQEADPAAVK